MTTTDEAFAEWVVLELMGHRRLAGYLTEQQIAGASFLRLDVPGPDGSTTATQFYRPESVYCITPSTEGMVRAAAAVLAAPAPVQRWELPPAPDDGEGPKPDTDGDDRDDWPGI